MLFMNVLTQTQKYGMQTEWLSRLKAHTIQGGPVRENPVEANK